MGIGVTFLSASCVLHVTFTAMLGVLAETGVLSSPRKVFSRNSFNFGKQKSEEEEKAVVIGKGALIRGMREVWLKSHIFLVSVFSIMLAVHIFLVYYYR